MPTKDGREITLRPCEVIRRFLLHVLPRGFVKIKMSSDSSGVHCDEDRVLSERHRV